MIKCLNKLGSVRRCWLAVLIAEGRHLHEVNIVQIRIQPIIVGNHANEVSLSVLEPFAINARDQGRTFITIVDDLRLSEACFRIYTGGTSVKVRLDIFIVFHGPQEDRIECAIFCRVDVP